MDRRLDSHAINTTTRISLDTKTFFALFILDYFNDNDKAYSKNAPFNVSY